MNALPPILVVDDSADDVFILTRLLLRAGVQNKVIGFEDPRPACSYLEGEGRKENSLFFPILVFTDLEMPNMDGCAFVTWIRQQSSSLRLPVYMITGSSDPAAHESAIAAGVNRVFQKFPSTTALAELALSCGCKLK